MGHPSIYTHPPPSGFGEGFDEVGEKGGAARHVTGKDEFVGRVGVVTDRAQTV